MAIVKCNNGHFYDSDKYSQCPHCGVIDMDDDERTMAVRDMPFADSGDDDKTVFLEQMPPRIVKDYGNSPMGINGSYMSDPDIGDKTISSYEMEKGARFMVGWLVCITGPERGRDYRLYQGFNRIGRDYGMDIAVMEDQSLSREAACAVVYDDRSNKFYAVQQQSSTAYLNGELLAGAVELSSGDIIKAGQSEFEFIAFCREGRIWE